MLKTYFDKEIARRCILVAVKAFDIYNVDAKGQDILAQNTHSLVKLSFGITHFRSKGQGIAGMALPDEPIQLYQFMDHYYDFFHDLMVFGLDMILLVILREKENSD
jgi:hypothetical protein